MQDAYRQTRFLLQNDLALFERSMNLQLQAVSANSKLRTPQAAALFGFWSRVFSHLADVCALLTRASYASCPPLLRTACDAIAAQRSLVRDGFEEYEEWLEGAIRQEKEQQALAFDLGRFRAGSALAEDPRLGAAYRLLTDLSMPHFGSTAFLVAPDSNLEKLSLAFADSTFHLGWAELVAGWLLALSAAQLETAASSGVFQIDEAFAAEGEGLSRDISQALADPRRCRAEEKEGRFLFHNFRRAPTGLARKVML